MTNRNDLVVLTRVSLFASKKNVIHLNDTATGALWLQSAECRVPSRSSGLLTRATVGYQVDCIGII
jgi:hypothetical protein